MNEENELHNRNLHISGLLNKEKVDIGDAKVDIKNEKVNPFSIAHYLTEHYLNGDIFKEELKKAASGEIISAVYYDDLNYLPLLNDRNEIEHL